MLKPEYSLVCPIAKEALPELPIRLGYAKLSKVASLIGDRWIRPNVEDWCAGDVVLFRRDASKLRDAGSPTIEAFQRQVGAKFPEWVHVGIYDGDGLIHDARPKTNVGHVILADVIEEQGRIHVRRLQGLVTSTRQVRSAIREQEGAKYSLFTPANVRSLARRLVPRLSVQSTPGRDLDLSNVICSVFVDRVLSLAAGRQIFRKLPLVLPCDFAESENFTCVKTEWCLAQALGA